MIQSPITYYGGKKQMLKHIIPMIPSHTVYCEPFFGGGAVFFAKKPAKCEMINDINNNVINFYKVYQLRKKELFDLIKCSLLSRNDHDKAKYIYQHPNEFNDIDRAWAFWFLANTCFNGDMYGNIKFSRSDQRSYRFLQNILDEHVITRLEKTQIDNRDALKVIAAMDQPITFFYVDPPYMDADQGHYSGYTIQDFAKLIVTLSNIKGKFLLSCYPGPLINKAVKKYKWNVKQIRKKSSASAVHGKTIRGFKVEMLVYNYHDYNSLELFQNDNR